MKKNLLTTLTALMALLAPATVSAQENGEITGYVNAWIDIRVAPEGAGQVAYALTPTALKTWGGSKSYNAPLTTFSLMGSDIIALQLYARPVADNGYSFAGWYLDNGDGVLNIEEDEFLDDNDEYYFMSALPDDVTLYDTQAAALNGVKPSQVQDVIFAYFTNGAVCGVSYYQDDEYTFHGNCGNVWSSKPANVPGDEVTVRALPNDGFHFEYWSDAFFRGEPVSRENPYTFTVKGGERLYAYFSADDAPTYSLPAEGGFKVVNLDATWFLSDESVKNGALALVLEEEDLKRTDSGQVYLDMDNENSHFDNSQIGGTPTLLYGKGDVKFAYKTVGLGYSRTNDPLVKWSGAEGTTVSGDVIYAYVFIEKLGAFVEVGNTDNMANPNAPTSVDIPANVAYFSLPAFDLTDDEGNIPSVIGLSPATYDRALVEGKTALDQLIAAVDGVKRSERTLGGLQVYTLSGVRLTTTPEKGVYIVNGKKVVLK